MPRRLLYLVRHGETDWNAAQRWQGHTDIPLNATGRLQARAVAASMRKAGLAHVASSDLARAKETAEIVAAELAVGAPVVDVGLRERAFGCFEGLTRAECERLHPEAWRAWLADRRPPVGAESHEELTARALAALRRLADAEGGPALVVTHGGTIRAVVAVAAGASPAPVPNGDIWRVVWDDGVVEAERAEFPL